MDSLLDLPARLGHALFAMALILMSLSGPKGPPSAPSAQLASPFYMENLAKDLRLSRAKAKALGFKL